MRSYGQYCALAKALDVVGDRWTLLIVRELLAQGPSRYTDLKAGLPGIATNLLAERLAELEKAGLIHRRQAPPPIAATLFDLTYRGRELEAVVMALGVWGVSLLDANVGKDVFQTHWLAVPLRNALRDRTPNRPPIAIELRTGDAPLTLETVDGAVHARPGPAEDPDLVLSGPPKTIFGVLTGQFDVKSARKIGLRYSGNVKLLDRVQLDPLRRAQ